MAGYEEEGWEFRLLGLGRPRCLPTGFTSLFWGWRCSLLWSSEGRRGPRHWTSQSLLPSLSWLRPAIPHAPQEFCAEPQFICEDMSRTDVCQGRLGKARSGRLWLGPCSSAPGPTPQAPYSSVSLFPPSPCPHLSSQVTAGFLRPLLPSLCIPDSCAGWSRLDRVSKMATRVSSTSR